MDVEKAQREIESVIEEGQVEALAKILHNSGREAVEKRLIYRDDVPVKPFAEWAELPEPARGGRRSMARYLLAHRFVVTRLLSF